MRMRLLLALLIAQACLPPAHAQYHYDSGGSRVVQMNQTGLARPSGTYIGAGTMSQSARGLPPGGPGAIANPGLPAVNMGANIRTPGDNMYTQKPAQQRYNPGLPQAKYGANIGTPGDNMRSDMNYYQQGQQYRQAPQRQQPQGWYYKPGTGGVATYAEQTAPGGDGARKF